MQTVEKAVCLQIGSFDFETGYASFKHRKDINQKTYETFIMLSKEEQRLLFIKFIVMKIFKLESDSQNVFALADIMTDLAVLEIDDVLDMLDDPNEFSERLSEARGIYNRRQDEIVKKEL